jgi:Flp pilus assembly pilin Flp
MFDIIVISLKALVGDKRAVTAVEYSVIAALIIGAVATAFGSLGGKITSELGIVTAAM